MTALASDLSCYFQKTNHFILHLNFCLAPLFPWKRISNKKCKCSAFFTSASIPLYTVRLKSVMLQLPLFTISIHIYSGTFSTRTEILSDSNMDDIHIECLTLSPFFGLSFSCSFCSPTTPEKKKKCLPIVLSSHVLIMHFPISFKIGAKFSPLPFEILSLVRIRFFSSYLH